MRDPAWSGSGPGAQRACPVWCNDLGSEVWTLNSQHGEAPSVGLHSSMDTPPLPGHVMPMGVAFFQTDSYNA